LARITSRRPTDEEEDVMDDLAEDEEEELEEQTGAPAVSDSRRRRMLKRGEVPVVTVSPVRKDRPTPSNRPEVVKSRNFVVRFFQGLATYFQETRTELSKVTWLSREDTMRLTYIVIVVTAVSAIFLGFVGFLFGLLTQALATNESTVLAGALTIGLIIVVSGAWFFRDRLFTRYE